MSDQAACQLWRKHHRCTLGFELAWVEPAERACGRRAAHFVAAAQRIGLHGAGIPVVALHVAIGLGDDGQRQAVVGGRAAAGKTDAVHQHIAAAVGVDAGAFGIADARVDGEGGVLAGQRPVAAGADRQGGRMIQRQVHRCAGQMLRLRQARGIVILGMARDGAGGFNNLADGTGLQIPGVGMAALLTEIDGDRQIIVALELNRLQLAVAQRCGQPAVAAKCHNRIAGATGAGVVQSLLAQLIQTLFVG